MAIAKIHAVKQRLEQLWTIIFQYWQWLQMFLVNQISILGRFLKYHDLSIRPSGCHELSLCGSLRSPPEGTITRVLTVINSISHIPRTCGWFHAQVFHIDSGLFKLCFPSPHCEVLFLLCNHFWAFILCMIPRVWPGLFTGLWFSAACLLWSYLPCLPITLSVCRQPRSKAWALTLILPCLRCVWSLWLNSACLTCIPC